MNARAVSFFVLALAAAAASARAQTPLMKCWEADGRVLYSDRGCDAAAASRQLQASPWGSEPVPARKPVTPRSPQKASERAGGAPGAAAAMTAAAGQRPAGAVAAPGAEDQMERERMQAQRDDYRRDVNRTRDLRSKLAPLGY